MSQTHPLEPMMVCMERICSYCKKSLGTKEPVVNTDVTHGICPGCFASAIGRLLNLSTPDFLNFFDQPMLAVDRSNRVKAYNLPFSNVLLSGREKANDLEWGEFIDCRYSKPAGRCGNRPPCCDCSSLALIRKTFQTSQPLEKIQIDLTPISEDSFLQRTWTVSFAKIQELVHLTFQDAGLPN